MTFNRRADGTIPEKQDRPGTAKSWRYIVYHIMHGFRIPCDTFDRLDEAIDRAELDCQDYDKVQIDQVTITRVWDNLMDYPDGKRNEEVT